MTLSNSFGRIILTIFLTNPPNARLDDDNQFRFLKMIGPEKSNGDRPI